ncbi:DUF2931 family protein [Epilithonimonas mollis]|uniref:DUF2931 family protein n=1 Tax=Epilithonimonas mollis TaxID=216903 RepID=A0A1M6R742_9FLAO|nr:DUF2931 family protein [Epilithonimonas mollis]SHK28272.1 Protein of unknown function [Epilithonimonas mollis]
MKKNIKTRLIKEFHTLPHNLLLISLSLLLFSCQKKKYPWQPGISAPRYYPVAGHVDFGNAGNGSNTSFANGWGDQYGGVVSGNQLKEVPKQVYIDYYSVVDGKGFSGEVLLPQEKILDLFREYHINDKNSADLLVGMAPGGWIRVWFQVSVGFVNKGGKVIIIEVAKSRLRSYKDETVGVGLKTKDFKTWGNTYTYWQHHGIPYSAWAENEKEYDIIFDFYKPNHRKIGFSYISADGTIYQVGREKAHQKLPVQLEQIAWQGKNREAYNCKVPFPKNFKKYIEQKKLQRLHLQLEIEKDDEHAIIYLITNNSKEKIVRFKNKTITAEEDKNIDFDYAKEVEYFIQ